MKFLVIGLGSMGKRRIRNLMFLGHTDIYGFDIRRDRLNESKERYGIKVVRDIKQGLLHRPDLIIISTSPDTHLKYVELATKNKIPFFTEVNTEPQHIQKIVTLMKKHQVIGISSMTMKFHPAIKIIKDYVEKKKLGKIYFLNYHSGENLEDWHPWESVQDYYVKSIATGGGRDQAVFELEWIFWMLGKPKNVIARTDKITNTSAKIFDIYNMTFTLHNIPIVNIVVDVIQRPPNRILRVVCEYGIITWDWISGMVRIYDSRDKKWKEFSHGDGYKGFNVEEMYQEEMKNVIESVRSKKNFVSSFESELFVAKSVIFAEKSSKERRIFKIQ